MGRAPPRSLVAAPLGPRSPAGHRDPARAAAAALASVAWWRPGARILVGGSSDQGLLSPALCAALHSERSPACARPNSPWRAPTSATCRRRARRLPPQARRSRLKPSDGRAIGPRVHLPLCTSLLRGAPLRCPRFPAVSLPHLPLHALSQSSPPRRRCRLTLRARPPPPRTRARRHTRSRRRRCRRRRTGSTRTRSTRTRSTSTRSRSTRSTRCTR